MQNDIEEYPKIRKLTRKDRKTFTAILAAFASFEGNKSLKEIIPKAPVPKGEAEEKDGDDSSDKMLDLITKVMDGVLETLEEDVAKWFIDLLGVTKEQYDELPFDIEIHVVEQLKANAGFSNFFAKAFGLYKKIKG